MIEVIWDESFKRKYKKLVKKNESLKQSFWETIDILSNNPYEPSLKTHPLAGKLKDCHACSINYDYRIIFQFIDSNVILLIDIGNHDEVYR